MLYLWSRRFSGTNAEAKCSFSQPENWDVARVDTFCFTGTSTKSWVPYLVPDLYVARMWNAVNVYVNFRTKPTGPISENFQPLRLSIVQND
jgi:hypothetical protein